MADLGKVLALIPARGGSKGIPGKNLSRLLGRPMVEWTIRAAQGANGVHQVVVSSDDQMIISVSEALGVASLKRPGALAQDDSPAADVAFHALQELPGYDWLLLLQPTSPLRTSADIQRGLELASTARCAVVSVTDVQESPFLMHFRDDKGYLEPVIRNNPYTRRQDLPNVVRLNGALYLVPVPLFLKERSFMAGRVVGLPMPEDHSIDIDNLEDLKRAEVLLKKRFEA